MKYVLYGLVGLFLLVAAAVFVGPSLIDWNAYKPQIARQFERETGRSLVIEGDISLQIVPTPTFSASNVRLANIAEGSDQDMAQIRNLLVRVALMPLFRRDLQVQTIQLVKPEILLEVLEDGRRNWDFPQLQANVQPAMGTAGDARIAGVPVNIRLDNFEIQDANLTYRNVPEGVEETLTNIDLDLFAETLNGPFQAQGDGRFRGVNGEIDVFIGRLSKTGATALRLGLELPRADAEASFSGTVSQHPGSWSFRGDLAAKGSDLVQTLRELDREKAEAPEGEPWPALLSRPYSLAGKVSGGRSDVNLQQLALTLGNASATAEASLSLGAATEGRLAVSVPRLDLDDLLSEPETESPGPATPWFAALSPGALEIPSDFAGKLDIGVETLILREQVVRQVTVTAQVEKGRLVVEQAAALLPGGAAFSLAGEMDSTVETPRFVGQIEAATSNLRSQLSWLGVDVGDLPADRLRRMTLRSGIGFSGSQIDFTELDLAMDLSQINGGLVIALRDRPAFGVGLAIDKIDLDAYLPVGFGLPPGVVLDAVFGAMPEDSWLAGYDANFNLQIAELVTQGISLGDVGLTGTVQQGWMELQGARIGDLVGSRVEVSSKVTGAKMAPGAESASGADLEFKFGIGDPARLSKLAGFEQEIFARFGPSEATGSLSGTREDLNLDLEVNSLGGELALAGKLRPLADASEFDLEAAVRHGNLAILLNRLVDLDETLALGPLDLKGRLAGSTAAFTVSDLEGEFGSGSVTGEVVIELSGARPKVTADLETGPLPLAGLLPVAFDGVDPGVDDGDAASGEGWSRDPVKLDGLRALDAGLRVRAETLTLDRFHLDRAELEAELLDGTLDLKRLSGDFLGGSLRVTGKARMTDQIEIDAGISAERLDLRALLQSEFDTDRAEGPVTLVADLVARGRSEHDLVAGLIGQGTLQGEVKIRAQPQEPAEDLLLGLLGDGPLEAREVSDVSRLVSRAFTASPAALSGGFVIDKGVVSVRDLRLAGQGADLTLVGKTDLATWTADLRAEVFDHRADDRAVVSLEIEGPLGAPGLRIDEAVSQGKGAPPAEMEGEEALPASLPAGDPAAPEADDRGGGWPPLEPAKATPRDDTKAPNPTGEDVAPEVESRTEVAPEAPQPLPEAAIAPPPSKPERPGPADFINQILKDLQTPSAE